MQVLSALVNHPKFADHQGHLLILSSISLILQMVQALLGGPCMRKAGGWKHRSVCGLGIFTVYTLMRGNRV